MTRILTVSLVTLGDPGRLTGGYRYHRRMAELAPACDASLRYVSVPDRPFPLPAWPAGPRSAGPGPTCWRWTASPPPSWRPGYPAGGRDAAGRQPAPAAGRDRPRAAAPWPPGPAGPGRLPAPPGCWWWPARPWATKWPARGFPAERIRVVPPGRDLPAAPYGPPVDLRQGRRGAVLCVANWVERKGLLGLLEAVARLPDGLAILHLAGDDRAGQASGHLRDRLARPDLAGRVVVHGPVPAERVAALYQAADVFALPSRREPYRDGVGRGHGRRAAGGRPRAGNLPHLAEHGREASLAEPGDVDALAAALARLAGDDDLRQPKAAAAAWRAAARPTWAQSRCLAGLREAADGQAIGSA